MIGIDTNVLLRFILADDAEQLDSARAFLTARSADDPAFVSLMVLAETYWVLRRRYKIANEVVVQTFRQLLDSQELMFEDESFLESLLIDEYIMSADLSDHFIARIALNAGCQKTVTFDINAAKSVPGMELLQ
ncbi:MAG: type II toxin-antitoxin system VapC family toxin [Rhizobium sp.]|nr:type II toxin-antitoxin system VapC family toxin [Rhizobium sp.]